MTKQRYAGVFLILIVILFSLGSKMTGNISDIYTFLYILVVIPGLVFMFKYYPKDKKVLRKKIFIYLGFCVVLAIIFALFL